MSFIHDEAKGEGWQWFLLIISDTCVCSGFVAVGGYENVREMYPDAVPTLNFSSASNESSVAECGKPPATAFNLFRPVTDPLPWPGVFFGLTVSAVWYWCTDQVGDCSFC